MKQIFSLLLIVLFALGCSSDDDCINQSDCDYQVIVDEQQYANVAISPLTIISLELIDDCLTINFGASGCDGNTWNPQLIDAGIILESLPPQRNLKFAIHNLELCDAYITKEISFDVSNLQVDNSSVLLNITNEDESILYTY